MASQLELEAPRTPSRGFLSRDSESESALDRGVRRRLGPRAAARPGTRGILARPRDSDLALDTGRAPDRARPGPRPRRRAFRVVRRAWSNLRLGTGTRRGRLAGSWAVRARAPQPGRAHHLATKVGPSRPVRRSQTRKKIVLKPQLLSLSSLFQVSTPVVRSTVHLRAIPSR